MAGLLGITEARGVSITQRFTLISATEIINNILSGNNNGRQDLLNDLFYFKSAYRRSGSKAGPVHVFEKYQINNLPAKDDSSIKYSGRSFNL